MTPTNGDGSVEGNGAPPQHGDLNGEAIAPPPPKISARREVDIGMAVLQALHQRDPKSHPPAPLDVGPPDPAPPPEVARDPDHPVHKKSRGAGLLPPDVRKRLQADTLPQVAPSMMRRGEWNTIWSQVFVRLLLYSWTAVKWLWQTVGDRMRGIDSLKRRALRLRLVIERLGGSAVKLGQQLAMRIDLLPYEYTVELSKLMDRMPPFPTEYAIGRIEKFLGRPLGDIFKEFNPVPIGSASVACVFSAYLESGDRVAIKVRRPHIGEQFVADCEALGLVLKSLEFLTILRPGLSHNFLYDFRSMLLEELDFKKECRYTELFRRRVHKRMSFVSAPKVYPEISCDDILVTEFLEGIWLREMLNAVEQQDEAALTLLRAQGIYPELVATRLLRANQFGVFENLLFHADPHPSNVVVQANSRIVFIDFGACGVYTSRERNVWRQFAYYHQQEDVGRMVQSAVALLEPLPPIDIDELSKRLENVFWEDLYAFKSKHTQWWERTSAKIWIKYMELAREYEAPLALNTLRMIRSTLLYETVAARLFSRVNAFKEHRNYLKTAGKAAKKRVRQGIEEFMFHGPSLDHYRRIEQLMDMGNRTIYLAQRWLDQPPFHFSLMVDKFVYAVSQILKTMITFVFFTLGAGFVVLLYHVLKPGGAAGYDIWKSCMEVLSWRPYQLLIGFNLFLSIRRVMMRLFDKDVQSGATGLS